MKNFNTLLIVSLFLPVFSVTARQIIPPERASTACVDIAAEIMQDLPAAGQFHASTMLANACEMGFSDAMTGNESLIDDHAKAFVEDAGLASDEAVKLFSQYRYQAYIMGVSMAQPLEPGSFYSNGE